MSISFRSLPVRLSFWISSILLFFILEAMGLIGYWWFRDLSTMMEEQGLTSAREMAYTMDRVFVQSEIIAQNLANILENADWKKEEIQKHLATVVATVYQKCPEITGGCISWMDGMLVPGEKYNTMISFEKNGEFVHKVTGDEFPEYMRRDWFMVPTTLEQPVWTVPFKSELGLNSLLLSYSTPFYKNVNGKREIAGATVTDIRMNALEKYLQPIGKLKELSKESRVFLLNQFGQIVLSPEKTSDLGKTIYTLCAAPYPPNPRDRKEAKAMFNTPYGNAQFNNAPILDLDVPCNVFYAKCVNNWVVCIAIPENWIQQILLPRFGNFLFGCALIIVIIVFVIFWISRRLSKPLVTLAKAAESVGEGNFSAPLPEVNGEDEIADLTKSFQRMQTELTDYIKKLEATVAARERVNSELSAARAIQKDILPHILPPLPLFPNVTGAADLIPARGVGGDLYDVFPVDKNTLAIIIGDVSGKGVPAALFMAVTQTLQRSIAQSEKTPGGLATCLNDMLASHDASMFVTYWVGFLNTQTGKIIYSNGAHNPPLLKRADGQVAVLRERHGLPLGAIAKQVYGSAEIQLSPGDTLILYTDGVTEAFNAQEEMFGENRLLNLVETSKADLPGILLMEIRDSIFEFTTGAEQSDDITLLIVRYDGFQN